MMMTEGVQNAIPVVVEEHQKGKFNREDDDVALPGAMKTMVDGEVVEEVVAEEEKRIGESGNGRGGKLNNEENLKKNEKEGHEKKNVEAPENDKDSGVQEQQQRDRRRREGDEEMVRKEEAGALNSSVILKIKRNPGLSVTVQYAEDGEHVVEFQRHESSDQTESSDSEDDDEEEDDDDDETEVVVMNGEEVAAATANQQWLLSESSLKLLLEKTRVRRRDGWDVEGLYTVDGDYDPLLLPQLENARVQANRSILVNRMAEAAFVMKLPPSGLYLAVLLLDFYWGHDRAMGRRMDSVQLVVLAYTCLYVGSNRFSTPGRTPDEFCRWAGVAERSVKGCMIIRQLEAFEILLHGPEKVSSITSQSLWAHMKHLDPEEHMSNFIRHLEGSEYGRAYFTPAVLKDAHDVKGNQASTSTSTSLADTGKVMKNRLLSAASMIARNKRRLRDGSIDSTETSTNKPAKMICLQKIAVL